MKIKEFLKKWQNPPDYDKGKPVRSFFVKIYRIFFFSIRDFINDECYLKAALLTFYFLISIVPFLAIALSVAKELGLEDFLQKQILETFKEQNDVLSKALSFASSMLGHIETQFFAGFSLLFLFFGVLGLLENVEKTMNDIWKVPKKRSFIRRMIIYSFVVIIFPLFFITSSAITIFINAEFLKIANEGFLEKTSSFIFMLAPYFLMWVLFSIVYILTPNVKTNFKACLLAGIFAGTLFQIWQLIYIYFQFHISNYNIVYGSFAALPFFLLWMQVNFIILLFGAEIANHIEKEGSRVNA